jgi:hypothetical protein
MWMARMRAGAIMLGLLICGALGALAPAVAAASISGKVTEAAAGHAPIQGIEVCSHAIPYTSEDICATTDASGDYSLGGVGGGSYYVRFSPGASGLNYVAEYYDNKQISPGKVLTIAPGQELTGIDAELEKGGVISGIATDAVTLGPAVGAWVCVEDGFPYQFGVCTQTGPGGEYEVNAMPTREYTVAFHGGNSSNYLRQFYGGGETWSSATHLAITAGSTRSGIDATLHPGAQILGNVTEAGTGAPLNKVEVCLLDSVHAPSPEYTEDCDATNVAGNYAIRSLPQGIYQIVFSQETGFIPNDYFFEQWYDGVPSAAQATKITIAPPETRSGVNARLTGYGPSSPSAPPAEATVVPASQSASTTAPLKCKKGFRRERVKGRGHCVKKAKRHHRRSRRRAAAR